MIDSPVRLLYETAMKIDTLAIHVGQTPDPTTGAIMTPVYQNIHLRSKRSGRTYGL